MCCAITFSTPRYHLPEALSNLGFGRHGAYGIQSAAPPSALAVRVARIEPLDTIARLALVEIQHRSALPMFAPARDRPLAGMPPSTVPGTKTVPSTFSLPSAGTTSACSPSN